MLKLNGCRILASMNNLTSTQTMARVAANALPIYRGYRGFATAERLKSDMQDPADRTWQFARRVAFDASTDMADGVLARIAGATILGGFLDQMADKFWYHLPVRQLVKNGELSHYHEDLPLSRDIGGTAIRLWKLSQGRSADAKRSGKDKYIIQATALTSICSPMAVIAPDLVRSLFDISVGLSVVSGYEMLRDVNNILDEYSAEVPVLQTVSRLLDSQLDAIAA
ncbi:MAG: CDP-diacylglycerol--glycerol-3-phosphate 3-phosphatidyltransferase [Candidatus Saccharibacteria bacterium]|nr:CDP-diacylglycerol--glycerol-3-phosphate 3-phosphatidyltransferase [Candidatus Saccharibacteria bacterium]